MCPRHNGTLPASGTTLNRTAAGVGGVLIGGVQSLSLTYYAAGFDPATNTGPTTTVPGNLKAVRIQLTTRPERPADTGTPATSGRRWNPP